jgi:hypothetical protein
MDSPISLSEPLSRGIGLHGFRMALLAMWGEGGLRSVSARLPDDVRAATLESIVLPVSWYPVKYTIAWDEAVWDGPVGRDDAAFCAFLDKAIELGFGRMRRFFIRLQSPVRIIERSPEMWRYQHTHGTLAVVARDVGATITLRDHPFTRHPLARRATAEVYRHIASMTRLGRAADVEIPGVHETHGAEGPDALVVRLSWGRR